MLDSLFTSILLDLCDTQKLNTVDRNEALYMLSKQNVKDYNPNPSTYDKFTDLWMEHI